MDDTSITINGIWFIAAISTLIAVMLVAVIWQVGGAVRARASAAREDAYRDLTKKSSEIQTQTSAELGSIAADLTDIKTRLTSMERMMREVE